jgi:transcription antitermination factor NusG
MAFWTAAQVRSTETKRAIWHVERQGFETYLPLCRPTRRSAKVVPLFPGYLFVCIVDRWRCLLGTYGVIDVLRSGDAPARVREHEIERMHQQEGRDGVIILPLTKFQPGECVRVVRGAFVDRTGIYSGMSARDRVRIMFTMFEREVSIELRDQDVIAAG